MPSTCALERGEAQLPQRPALQTTGLNAEVALERVVDVHQHLQMGPVLFSPQRGENWFIRKHLGRADAVAHLLLALTPAVLAS